MQGRDMNMRVEKYECKSIFCTADSGKANGGYYFGMPGSINNADDKAELTKARRRVSIGSARPGMIVAKDVYSRNDQLVLPKDTELTPDVITKMMFYAVDSVFIYNEEESTNKDVSEENEGTIEFRKEYAKTLENVKYEFEKAIVSNASIDEDKLLANVDEFFNKDAGKAEVLSMLHNIKKFDDHVYMHSINVSLLCKIFAGWLGISGRDEEILVLCGLLHDIGKMLIPKNILNKPSELTRMEYEMMKQHTLRGYELLNGKDIDERVKFAALRHHERYDGKGYPNGCKSEEIDMYSMITGIADTYDTLASEHIYSDEKCPYDILFDFENKKQIFAPQYLLPIINNIAESYINHEVTLSNNEKASIVMLNADDLSKPVVRVNDKFIDLSKERSIKIKKMN